MNKNNFYRSQNRTTHNSCLLQILCAFEKVVMFMTLDHCFFLTARWDEASQHFTHSFFMSPTWVC